MSHFDVAWGHFDVAWQKLWHKNDIFDEILGCAGHLTLPKKKWAPVAGKIFYKYDGQSSQYLYSCQTCNYTLLFVLYHPHPKSEKTLELGRQQVLPYALVLQRPTEKQTFWTFRRADSTGTMSLGSSFSGMLLPPHTLPVLAESIAASMTNNETALVHHNKSRIPPTIAPTTEKLPGAARTWGRALYSKERIKMKEKAALVAPAAEQ